MLYDVVVKYYDSHQHKSVYYPARVGEQVALEVLKLPANSAWCVLAVFPVAQ